MFTQNGVYFVNCGACIIIYCEFKRDIITSFLFYKQNPIKIIISLEVNGRNNNSTLSLSKIIDDINYSR